jgi:hypothetical protein
LLIHGLVYPQEAPQFLGSLFRARRFEEQEFDRIADCAQGEENQCGDQPDYQQGS